ncbi:MAG: TolC family protein [Candidatus Thiodiazotropha sp. (ex Monitilora ramsayi)]|nr:TolC family protein [Candidatus Thiodiazotropha sp. (ex Monitilora ramsayi)]
MMSRFMTTLSHTGARIHRCLRVCNHRLHPPLLLIPLLATGQTIAANTADHTVFQDLLVRLQQHPALSVNASERRQWEASAEGALGLPNPNITLGINNVPVNEPTSFDRYLPSNRSLEFKQTIPNIKGREALRGTHLARASLADLEREAVWAGLHRRLITALAERRRIEDSTAALDQKLALLSELERWLRGEMAGGEAVYSRFDELDVRRAKIEEKKLTLAGEERRWQAELRELVDHVPSTAALPPITPANWSGAPETLLKIRIELGKLAVARAKVKERESAFSPDLAFGAAWQQREAGETFDGDDWFTLKFTASVPLWSGTNQTPKLQAAEANVTKVMAQQERQLREEKSDYETALADYHTADSLLAAMAQRQIRLQALEASNRRRYEAGDIDLEAVIRPAIQLADVDMDIAETEAKRTIAAARANALLVEENR